MHQQPILSFGEFYFILFFLLYSLVNHDCQHGLSTLGTLQSAIGNMWAARLT